MKVVILAGGLGTRLSEETETRPKPMVEVGGRPILWHIMKHYAAHGFREFVVAAGYKGEVIKRYFLDYSALNGDLTIDLASGTVEARAEPVDDWLVHLVDTGDSTEPAAASSASQSQLGDVDLHGHLRRRRLATSTSTRCSPSTARTASSPPSPPSGRRRGSAASSSTATSWPSSPRSRRSAKAGSTAASSSSSPRVFDYLDGDEASLEARRARAAGRGGQLAAYRHDGFWQCMDTLRDKRLLEELWDAGGAPWKVWETTSRSGATGPSLVTGGTGLVGAWLVRRLLAAGADVVCLVRDWVPQSRAGPRRA